MNTATIRFYLLSILTTLVLFLHCTDNDNILGTNVNNTNFEASEPFSSEVAVVNQVRLRLQGITGTIKIMGSLQFDSVLVSGVKRVGSESIEDAEAHLADLHVVVTDLGNEIFLKTEQPAETHGRNYVVDYNINLPQSMEVSVINVTGTVTIDSINSSVTVNNVTGVVTVRKISGNTNVVNVTGNVNLSTIAGNANVNLTTGDVNLTTVIGSASVNLVTGNITSQIFLPLNGIINLNLVTGNISLSIPVSTSAQFSAIVTTGNINLTNLELHNQQSSNNSVSGILGNGEGNISLRAVTGNIGVTGYNG